MSNHLSQTMNITRVKHQITLILMSLVCSLSACGIRPLTRSERNHVEKHIPLHTKLNQS